MKRLLAAAGLATALFTGQASAVPAFSFFLDPGYTGPIVIKFLNFEAFTAGFAVDSENFGILKVSSIETPGAVQIWNDAGAGYDIAGVFSNIKITSVAGTGASATGGLMRLFINPDGFFDATQGPILGYTNAACAPNTLCYNGISNVAGGGMFLDLMFAPGIDPGDGTTTVTATGLVTNPPTGSAQSYLDVIGGICTDRTSTRMGSRRHSELATSSSRTRSARSTASRARSRAAGRRAATTRASRTIVAEPRLARARRPSAPGARGDVRRRRSS